MDETAVQNDMVSNTTVEVTGSKKVPMKYSYEAHLADDNKKCSLTPKFKLIILAGCAKYTQALAVVQTRLFTDRIQEWYDNWLTNAKHENTASGNMKPVPTRLVVECEIMQDIDEDQNIEID